MDASIKIESNHEFILRVLGLTASTTFKIILEPLKTLVFEKQFDWRSLIPNCAYIHANFVESNTYIENTQYKVLAIVPFQNTYNSLSPMGFPLETHQLFNSYADANSIISKINHNSLSYIHLKITTEEGFPFPFNEENDMFSSFIITFSK